MAIIETTPEKVAELLVNGFAKELEPLIRERLKAVVDPIISELARDLARRTALQVQSYRKPPMFGDQTIVNIHFNTDGVVFTAEETTR